MKLVYLSQFRDVSGYAIAARGYLKALDSYLQDNPDAFELKIYSIIASSSRLSDEEESLLEKYEFKNDAEIDKIISEGYDLLWHLPPPLVNFGDDRFQPSPNCSPSMTKLMQNSNKSVNLLAWETDTPPLEWLRTFDYYKPDKVITPSRWNSEVFKSIAPQVDTVPHVIVDDDTQPLEIPLPVDLEDKFVVLAISQWTRRKGFDRLLQSFYAEFGDVEDAVLVIKTFDSVTHNSDSIKNEIKYFKNTIFLPGNQPVKKNNVILIDKYLPKNYINWLYDQADVFALFSRGEGFGLPIAESLIRQTPVVVPEQGGHLDFIHPEAGFFVSGNWDTCTLRIPPYGVEGRWFETSIDDGRRQLRNAYNLWKNDPALLKQKGATGREHILSLGIDYKSIGEKLYESIKSTKELNNELPTATTYSKDKIGLLRQKIVKADSLKEKVKLLHNSFEGETCYILNCGPSLKHYDQNYLKDQLGDKLVLAVKMAYNYCPEIVDFHFFNCCNMPVAKNGSHYHYDKDVISVGSSNYPEGTRWEKDQTTDIFFKIPIRTTVKNFLCHDRNFDDYMMEDTIDRPVGPGIMYETVLHAAVHLGVSNIVVLGWDLGGNPKTPMDFEHFYDNSQEIFNRGDMFGPEVEWALDSMKDMHNWLQNRGINLYIASNISRIDLCVPRKRI